jgi:hypothetical protein
MPSHFISDDSGQGRITHGPEPQALVVRTLEFVRDEMPRWRDRPDRVRETAEERLNAQLCKHLNARARKVPLPVMFHHEEKQAENRRVDLSAGLDEGGFVGSTYHSVDDPFLVLEGKRLPTPGGKPREMEYVTGGSQRSGGIQRFKLGLHGAGLQTVAMIGYIQQGNTTAWLERINGWITQLAQRQAPVPDEQWRCDEILYQRWHHEEIRVTQSVSTHPREGPASHSLDIWHLWVEMI